MTNAQEIVLATAALGQVADLLTTNAILRAGGSELNPAMAWAQASLGGWWLVPKLGLAAVLVWLLSRSRKPRQVAVLVVLASLGAVNNALVLLGS